MSLPISMSTLMVPLILSVFKKSQANPHAADIKLPIGLEVISLPIHSDWVCLPPPSHISQVAIYCHKTIMNQFHVAINHETFNHPNIFLYSVFDRKNGTSLSFTTTPTGMLPVSSELYPFFSASSPITLPLPGWFQPSLLLLGPRCPSQSITELGNY